MACAAILAQSLVAVVWEVEADEDVRIRWIGVLSILVAAGTILLFVLARLSRDEFAAASEAPDAVPVCPHCGGRLPPGLVARLHGEDRPR